MRILTSLVFSSFLLVACGHASPPASSASGSGGSQSAATGGSTAQANTTGQSAGAAGKGALGATASGGAGSSSGGGGASAGAAAGQAGASGAPNASAGNGGGGSGTGASGQSGGSAGSGPGLFPPVTDFVADGPFTPTELDNTGPSNNYTVYMPKEPAPMGAKNPIVGWMSGGGTVPSLYPLLPHLASHGFVVIASNTAPGIGDEVNLGKEIIAGIDWAIAENARQGSELFDRLDTTKLASMGYSMGSLATFTIANDPRLTTTVHISGGNMAPERIDNLHAPAAFLCGIPGDSSCTIVNTDCDIAAANCDTDFMNAKTPVFYANFPSGHLGILTAGMQERIHAEATAWLRWQLMGDTTLESRFVGDQCTVCKDTNWQKVQQKNL